MKTLSVFAVALHPEGVDRNIIKIAVYRHVCVALHPEGVDRNLKALKGKQFDYVALHPEGVDRNAFSGCILLWHACRPPPGGRG